MKPRERMVAVFEGETPDRVPTGELGVDYPVTEHVLGHPTYYRAKLREKSAIWEGKRDQVVTSQKADLVALAQTLEWDFLPVFLTYGAAHSSPPVERLDETTWRDAFGRTWKYSSVTGDTLCVEAPRLDESAIDVLRAPFVADDSEMELVRHVVETVGDSHFIVGRTSIELRDAAPVVGRGLVDGTFPEPYGGLMMDMVDFSLRLVDEPEFIGRLLAAATDRAIQVALSMVKAGVDAIVLDTDYCHQAGPWISRRHFGDIVFPLLCRTVEAIHSAGAYVIKHTDGNTLPILDYLLESGIDGLHGIQPSAGVDLARLRGRCGSKIVLFGAMEGEHLIHGNPAEIQEIVRQQIKVLGKDGRFVLTTSNSVQLGTPPANYLSMLSARKHFGDYPLT